MSNAEFDKLKETLWRRNLSSAEEAQGVETQGKDLGDRPELAMELQEERALNRALDRMPQVLVSSNFTARVLQAVALEEARISRETKRGWPAWRVGFGWVSRLATAGIAVLMATGVIYQSRLNERTQRAKSVAEVSHMVTLPTEWLENFEVISRLNIPAPVDEDLLAMLQ